MYRKFLNARSPLRLLEKGLHGGLGRGNVGVVLAGHGVGKTSFLVCVALDELLRGEHVLHVTLDQTVPHLRAFYDTVFDDLASTTHLEDQAVVRSEADRRRSLRHYSAAEFSPAKLREAVKVETEASGRPALVIVEGLDLAAAGKPEIEEIRALAQELDAEVWLSASLATERIAEVPASLRAAGDVASVVLALEPGVDSVGLRALKDHENPDVSALHVSLDPRTLLLIRS
ncbi:hypothetical protein MYXO_03691 [Myxococcaceae bacterium]|jgi:hypothetical protein|nr:hypothetical protein MYXO_03691 [Myxococcaceae bacterium]